MKTRRNAPRARRAPCRRLTVPAGQSRELVKFAGILEIRPEDFLRWTLEGLFESFHNPASGLLLSWIDGEVEYDTAEQVERVRNRTAAWLAGQEAGNARRDGKEGRAS